MVVARNGLTPVVAGLVEGMGRALAATRSINGLLLGVPATDPATHAGPLWAYC
jgi:hypothetical protein